MEMRNHIGGATSPAEISTLRILLKMFKSSLLFALSSAVSLKRLCVHFELFIAGSAFRLAQRDILPPDSPHWANGRALRVEGVGCRGDESTLCIIEGTGGAAASLEIPSLAS